MAGDLFQDGVTLIAIERRRQKEREGYTCHHDAQHDSGQLAMAAVCYAAPERIYIRREYAAGMSFVDPFPDGWPDKRFAYGENRKNRGNVAPDPGTYTDEEAIDLLVKAGALIAAEIDRLQRKRGTNA